MTAASFTAHADGKDDLADCILRTVHILQLDGRLVWVTGGVLVPIVLDGPRSRRCCSHSRGPSYFPIAFSQRLIHPILLAQSN